MIIYENNRQAAIRAARYMRRFAHCVSPVNVMIRGKIFAGARYVDVSYYEAGMQGVQNGSHYIGEARASDCLYLLGDLPACYRHSSRVAFMLGGKDWYVSGWYPSDTPNQYHPLGRAFFMREWDTGDAIDRYNAYKRFPLTVQTI
jgi:hypothetical protein